METITRADLNEILPFNLISTDGQRVVRVVVIDDIAFIPCQEASRCVEFSMADCKSCGSAQKRKIIE